MRFLLLYEYILIAGGVIKPVIDFLINLISQARSSQELVGDDVNVRQHVNTSQPNARHNGTQSSVQDMLAAPVDLLHTRKSTVVEPVRTARPSV